ncbi:MAG: membrane protein insertion efficiency factor YidD [Syntrophales bacterium]|nr:membrane protein insertion efficiency factor YidD [Syntrophales bacterium]
MFFAWILLATTTGWGAGAPFEPWEFGDRMASPSTAQDEKRSVSLPARMALEGLNFFSEYISKVDGDRCPMYPTCASYSRQVFKKHGFFMGVVMTSDRLIHEGSEMRYAPLVKVGGSVRYYDPVSENDFWWYNEEGLDK